MRRETFEVRVVDGFGCILSSVPVKGTVDGIIRRKQWIVSYILSQLDGVDEEDTLFFELYDITGEFITMLN